VGWVGTGGTEGTVAPIHVAPTGLMSADVCCRMADATASLASCAALACGCSPDVGLVGLLLGRGGGHCGNALASSHILVVGCLSGCETAGSSHLGQQDVGLRNGPTMPFGVVVRLRGSGEVARSCAAVLC
jgi:hypothetical protein